ncbi:hypothetical protein DV735_g4333, partial [Chaetothyriales sp. CBS 134920]
MFAVPGWDLRAEALVTEKPSTKTGGHSKSKADAHSSAKRKWSQSEGEHEHAHLLEAGDLVKRRATKQPGNDASQEGEQEPKASGNNGRKLRDAEDKLSRKQKKLWNRKQSSQVNEDGGQGKSTEGAESDNALQDMQHQPTSTELCGGPERKREGALHDPKPNRIGKAPSARLAPPGASPQQDPSKFAAKLTSARFRHLNEQLYTTRSAESLQLFKSQPALFTDYHLGFTQQTQSWPVNPVNLFITALQTRQDLPRHAPLARALAYANTGKKLGLRIHSFDLHSVNEHVTVADMADLPLRDGEADIAIFCLSLMGTNWLDFVEECWRILRGDGKGEVWVAEVKSRFVSRPGRRAPGEAVDNSVGKKRRITKKKSTTVDHDNVADDQALLDGEADAFVSVFHRRGFKLKEGSVDDSNKMFVTMVFYKSGVPMVGKYKGMKWNGKAYQNQDDPPRGTRSKFGGGPDANDEVDPKEEAAVLKPCVYKTR